MLPVTLEENLYIENVDAIVLKEHLLLGQRKEKKKWRAPFLSDKWIHS